MKSVTVSLVLAGAFVAIIGVGAATAQIDSAVQFTTSFPFTAGTATLPAGSYPVTPDDLVPTVLLIRGSRARVFLNTTETTSPSLPSKTEVVFDRYKSGYALKNILVAGSEIGYAADVTVAARHLNRTGETPAEHRVAARAKHATISPATKTAANR